MEIHPYIPIVPSTPAPCRKEDVQHDFKNRFAGIMWISKEKDKAVGEYLMDYDHWEEYSELKSYSKRPFFAPYNGLMREYQNYLCIIEDVQEYYYVVSKRVHSELENLEKYCPCIICSSWIINPLKYLWCPYCIRCIKAGPGIADPEYVERAKMIRMRGPSKYQQYIKDIPWNRVVEVIMVLMCVYIMCLN